MPQPRIDDIRKLSSPEQALVEFQEDIPAGNIFLGASESVFSGRRGLDVRGGGRVARTVIKPTPLVGKVLAPLNFGLDYTNNLADGQSKPRALRNAALETAGGTLGTLGGAGFGVITTPMIPHDDYIYSFGGGLAGQEAGRQLGDLIDRRIYKHTDTD